MKNSIGGLFVKKMIEDYEKRVEEAKASTKPRPITVAEVRALALKHYNNGGDGVYECYEDYQIELEIQDGKTTEEDWLEDFLFFKGVSDNGLALG